MDADFTTDVRFYRLSEELQPYFTALYATSVECSPDVWVKDRLHPEWAALRFTEGPAPVACVGVGELLPQWSFVANGPTSKAIQFGVTRSRVWGLGLQPAGWSKFIGQPANGLRRTGCTCWSARWRRRAIAATARRARCRRRAACPR